MLNIKQIEIEYKISVIFAGIAFIISLLSGFITGNDIGLIIIRSFISLLVFLLLGYSVVFVLKKYVPEVYQLFRTSNEAISTENSQIDIQDASETEVIKPAEKKGREDNSVSQDAALSDTYDKTEVKDNDFEDEIATVDKEQENKSEHIPGATVKKSKLESDIEQRIKYEPKIVAEAVRTMMRRDEE